MADNDERVERAAERATAAANTLAKWRTFFAGWQLGTTSGDDGPTKAIKNHREATILMRAEVNALTRIVLDAGLVSQVQLTEIMAEEYEQLAEDYANTYRGIRASLTGLTFSLPEARDTMDSLGFPP